MRTYIRSCFILFILCTTICAAEPAIWQVKGKHNTVYLLGTIHLLPGDEAMPDNIGRAYREAEQLLMEIDMDDLDPVVTQTLMFKLGLQPAGQTLAGQLATDTQRQLQAAASRLGLDAAVLAQFQPWLAALTLEQLQLAKLGFAATAGVEMQLMQMAAADNKPINGLETLEEQLRLFAQLDNKAQVALLQNTLDELDAGPAELQSLVTAWRGGDEQQLRKTLQQGHADDPALFAALTTARNKRWLVTLKPLLEQQHDDYLVAVGALHMIGKDGLVELLRRAGYAVTRH